LSQGRQGATNPNDDLDAAIELAAKIPAARLGGAVEVRPTKQW
jgi:hypothetical protein